MWSLGVIVYTLLGDENENTTDRNLHFSIYSMLLLLSLLVAELMFIGGYPPFFDDNTEKLIKLITSGEWHFHPEYWGSTSLEAKDFISKLLESKL